MPSAPAVADGADQTNPRNLAPGDSPTGCVGESPDFDLNPPLPVCQNGELLQDAFEQCDDVLVRRPGFVCHEEPPSSSLDSTRSSAGECLAVPSSSRGHGPHRAARGSPLPYDVGPPWFADCRLWFDHGEMIDASLEWLAEGDPAIRWQVERDLLDRSRRTWRATRAAVEREGWGRRLLDEQDPGGTWGNGLYTPKWTSTTYTLLLLRRLGLPSSNERAIAGSRRLFDDANWYDGGVSYWASYSYAERCVNGMVLAIGTHFEVADRRVDSIAELLVGAAMPDGGWNCEDVRGATHSSFHTTISSRASPSTSACWAKCCCEGSGNGNVATGLPWPSYSVG